MLQIAAICACLTAATALGVVQSPASGELRTQDVARDTATQARVDAIYGLTRSLADAGVRKQLVEYLADPDAEVRSAATAVLLQLDFGDKAELLPLLSKPDPRVSLRLQFIALDRGPVRVPRRTLWRGWKDDDPRTRSLALRYLDRSLDDEEVLASLLIQAICDRDPHIREQALDKIAGHGPMPLLAPKLFELLGDTSDAHTRRRIYACLIAIGAPGNTLERLDRESDSGFKSMLFTEHLQFIDFDERAVECLLAESARYGASGHPFVLDVVTRVCPRSTTAFKARLGGLARASSAASRNALAASLASAARSVALAELYAELLTNEGQEIVEAAIHGIVAAGARESFEDLQRMIEDETLRRRLGVALATPQVRIRRPAFRIDRDTVAKALDDSSPEVRRVAIDICAAWGRRARELTPALLELAKQQDESTHSRAIRALASVSGSSKELGALFLRELQRDYRSEVAESILDWAGRSGEPGLEVLTEALADGPPNVRRLATTALRHQGSRARKLLPRLFGIAAQDPNPSFDLRLLDLLPSAIGHKPRPPNAQVAAFVAGMLHRSPSRTLSALIRLPQYVHDNATAVAGALEDPRHRVAALSVLANADRLPVAVAEHLVPLFDQPATEQERVLVVRAYSKLWVDPPKLTPFLVAALDAPDTCEAAARAITHVGRRADREMREALFAVIEARIAKARSTCTARALGQCLGSLAGRSRNAAYELLRSPVTDLEHTAAAAILAELGKQNPGVLRSALRSESDEVKAAALAACSSLGDRAAAALRADVFALASEPHARYHSGALQALASIDPARAIPLLERTIAAGRLDAGPLIDALIRIRDPAIAALARLADRPGISDRVSRLCVHTLFRLGAAGHRALLDVELTSSLVARHILRARRGLFESQDPAVRAWACRAIAHADPDPDLPDLVNELIDATHDWEAEVRVAAVKSLAAIADTSPRKVEALIASLRDRAPAVVSAAAKALGKLGPAAVDALPELRKLVVVSRRGQVWQAAAKAVKEIDAYR